MSAIEELTRLSEKSVEAPGKSALKRSADKGFLPKELNVVKINEAQKKEDSKTQKEFQDNIKKEAEESEKAYLFGKICDYYRAPALRAKIPANLKEPTTHTSLGELRQMWAAIKSACTFDQKKMFVDRIFVMSCMAIEKGFVEFGKDKTKEGLATNYLLPAKGVLFDADLEELAAELPNDYVPGAKVRIAMNLLQAVMSYDVRTIPVKEFSNSEKEEESEKK